MHPLFGNLCWFLVCFSKRSYQVCARHESPRIYNVSSSSIGEYLVITRYG